MAKQEEPKLSLREVEQILNMSKELLFEALAEDYLIDYGVAEALSMMYLISLTKHSYVSSYYSKFIGKEEAESYRILISRLPVVEFEDEDEDHSEDKTPRPKKKGDSTEKGKKGKIIKMNPRPKK